MTVHTYLAVDLLRLGFGTCLDEGDEFFGVVPFLFKCVVLSAESRPSALALLGLIDAIGVQC
jgi:hypothetical protein